MSPYFYNLSRRIENSLQVSRASIYTDYTNVTIASFDIKKLTDDAKQEILNLSKWMRINKLSSDPQKPEFMAIGHPRNKSNPASLKTLFSIIGS